MVKTFDETNGVLYESAWKSQFLSGLMQPIMAFVGNLGYAGVAISGGLLAMLAKYELSPSWIVVFGKRLEWGAIGIAVIPALIIGLVVISIQVWWYLRHEIIQIIRSE